jgi:hypothetical protein
MKVKADVINRVIINSGKILDLTNIQIVGVTGDPDKRNGLTGSDRCE